MLPDVNIGVSTSKSGYDDGYKIRGLLHRYTGSVIVEAFFWTILGEQPTINEETLCTYPEPWYHSKPYTFPPINKTLHPTRPLTDYVGIYNHIAYGNMVIQINTTVSQLQMNYGIAHWILYPETGHDLFAAEAFGLLTKHLDLSHVLYHIESNHVNGVELPGFSKKELPVFSRVSGNIAGDSKVVVG